MNQISIENKKLMYLLENDNHILQFDSLKNLLIKKNRYITLQLMINYN
jgi:hypothetical protein